MPDYFAWAEHRDFYDHVYRVKGDSPQEAATNLARVRRLSHDTPVYVVPVSGPDLLRVVVGAQS